MTVNISAPSELFEDNLAEKDWFFLVYQKLTEDLNTKTYTDFTPTLTASGAMTITSPVINYARYAIIGTTVFIEVGATFTTGGTPDLSVIFDLPYEAEKASVLSGCVVDGGNELSGFAVLSAASKTLNVRRYDGGNWSTGASRSFRLSGIYRTTETY